MYIDMNDVLYVAVLCIQAYVVLSIPAGLFILILSLKAKRDGRIPPDTDIQKVVLESMVTFPKVYYITILGLLTRLTDYLWDRANPKKGDTGQYAFKALLLKRLRENKELLEYLEMEGIATPTHDDGGTIGLKVSEMSGTTYIVLHNEHNFLVDIRQPDGTYDEYTMERLNSLHNWMVFDLVCAHPRYKELLPPEIISQISVKH